MTNLYFFIAGIIFIAVAVPILNAITDIVLAATEVLKSKMSVSIAESNRLIMEKTGNEQTNAIGFSCSDYGDEFMYDEEEDDIDLKKYKNIIGFGDVDGKSKK